MEVKNELINRDEDILKFIDVLANKNKINIEVESFNVALNGRWGDGKTTFVNALQEYIKNKENKAKIAIDQVFIINAWDYDFLDDPSEMFYHFLNQEKNNGNEILSLIYDVLKKCASEYIVDKIPFIKKFRQVKNEQDKKNIEKQKQFFNILELKKQILKAVETCEENIYIFIDDLDRCNPNFVIKLIELTKHIFNISNITVIYMLDWSNTNISIMKHYGLEIKNNDNEQYLSKIIDYKWNLPHLSKEEYLWKKYIFLNKKYDSFQRDFRDYFDSPELFDWYQPLFQNTPFRRAEKLTLKYSQTQNYIFNLINEKFSYTASLDRSLYIVILIWIDKVILWKVIDSEIEIKKELSIIKTDFDEIIINNYLKDTLITILNYLTKDNKHKSVFNFENITYEKVIEALFPIIQIIIN